MRYLYRGWLGASCERVRNNTGLSISISFHIAYMRVICVCHEFLCSWIHIFVCVTLCGGDHINFPKYCNNFALLFLLDFPLAIVGLFGIYKSTSWSDDMANRSFSSIASHHTDCLARAPFICHGRVIVFTCRTYSILRSIPFFAFKIFCLAFRCASFGRCPLEQRLIWPGFTFNKHSFRTFLSYQFSSEKQHPTSPTHKCPLAQIPNNVCANWRQLVGATMKRGAYPSLHICWSPWLKVCLEIALRGSTIT